MHSFPTSVGTVEIVVHEASRIVSISRLNAEGRPVASTMCDWDASDLATSIASVKVPLSEAREIADDLGTDSLRASALAAEGAVAAATGEPETACRCYEDAVDLFQRNGAVFARAGVGGRNKGLAGRGGARKAAMRNEARGPGARQGGRKPDAVDQLLRKFK